MGISADGESGLSMRALRSMLLVVVVLVGTFIYFYGPSLMPPVQRAAVDQCNESTGGNFRAYRLTWVSWPETRPHWSCSDARNPEQEAISLGWWVDPF
ncbi:MAG: hypothetical protein WBQ50_19285 [Nocardioides sp.]